MSRHQPQIFDCHGPLSCTIIVGLRLLLPPPTLSPCQFLAPPPPLSLPLFQSLSINFILLILSLLLSSYFALLLSPSNLRYRQLSVAQSLSLLHILPPPPSFFLLIMLLRDSLVLLLTLSVLKRKHYYIKRSLKA